MSTHDKLADSGVSRRDMIRIGAGGLGFGLFGGLGPVPYVFGKASEVAAASNSGKPKRASSNHIGSAWHGRTGGARRAGRRPAALEDRRLDPPSSQVVQERGGVVEHLGHAGRAGAGQPVVGGPGGRDGGDRAACRRGTVDGAQDENLAGRAPPAPHLDPRSADHALGMGRPQHRQTGSQAVAPGRGHSGRHPLHAGKGGDEKEGVGQRGAVAVLGTSTAPDLIRPGVGPTLPHASQRRCRRAPRGAAARTTGRRCRPWPRAPR